MMILKSYWLHILAVVSIALNAWLFTRPTPVPVTVTKTEYVDRVVEKEVVKVVNNDIVKYRDRVITRTITQPGGTKIVEQIKESGSQHDKSTTVDRGTIVDRSTSKSSTVAALPRAPRYLLGIGGSIDRNTLNGSLGIRLHDAIPIYLGAGVAKHGTAYNLTLNVGVLF